MASLRPETAAWLIPVLQGLTRGGSTYVAIRESVTVHDGRVVRDPWFDKLLHTIEPVVAELKRA